MSPRTVRAGTALFDGLGWLCRGIEVVFAAATVTLLAAILAINTLEIVSRTFLSVSFRWIYETNLLLASWMYFLGIYLGYRRGGDITVMGALAVLPDGWRDGYVRILHVVTGAIFLVVAWYAWTLVELQWPFRTPGARIPRAAFTIPLLLGLVAVGLDVLRRAADPRLPAVASDAPDAAGGET